MTREKAQHIPTAFLEPKKQRHTCSCFLHPQRPNHRAANYWVEVYFPAQRKLTFLQERQKNPSATKGNNKVPPPKVASYTGGEDEPFHFIAISPLNTVRLLHTFDKALLWRRRRTWRGNGLQLPFASPFSLRTARRLSVNINLIAPLSAPNSNRLAESDQGTYPGDEQNGVTAMFGFCDGISKFHHNY